MKAAILETMTLIFFYYCHLLGAIFSGELYILSLILFLQLTLHNVAAIFAQNHLSFTTDQKQRKEILNVSMQTYIHMMKHSNQKYI